MADLIGEQTIAEVSKRVEGLLREYSSDINKVYDEDSIIKIALPLEIKFDQQKNKIKLGIKFVTDKVEDESIGWAEETQPSLFDQKLTLIVAEKTNLPAPTPCNLTGDLCSHNPTCRANDQAKVLWCVNGR